MINIRFNIRALVALAALAVTLGVIVPLAHAGGPLLVVDRQPVRWARGQVTNPSNPNLKTVDSAGRVLYRVDSGRLGPLSNAEAVGIVDRIFKLYTDIPTADIEFVKAGQILDPATNAPVDVTGANFGRFANSNSPTYQNPIIFDTDSSITGQGGVLGFFGFLQFDESSNSLKEGLVVLNGGVLTRNVIGRTSFIGVFTHEFGHFAGPLDHAQINGNIAADGAGATLPIGFTAAQAFDLYAPFTETLFPFIFDAEVGSTLKSQFPDSGFFIASLDMDTINALSNLYPSADYHATSGSIEGRVLIRTQGGDIPITGINVVARRIDQGAYPPALGTNAFTTFPISVDGDGVPLVPELQGQTDSLATVSSAVTGLEFGAGTYRIQGLPSGQYLVEIQQLNPNALGGSGIGPLGSQFPLPVEEYYNAGRETSDSADSATDFAPVFVTAGSTATGIDIILNGISGAAPTVFGESEPNELTKKAQNISSIPAEITGSAARTDAGKLKMSLGSGGTDRIEDLYSFTITDSRTYFVILEPISGSGDLDLYLFNSRVNKKKSNLDDPNLLGASTSPASSELVALQLTPGKYIIGVSSFDGSVGYRLRIIPSLQ